MVFCCSSVAGGREIWSVKREAENIFMSIHSGTVFYERGKKRHKQINILFAVPIFADVDFNFLFSPPLDLQLNVRMIRWALVTVLM
jgi:hypothetical protein